MAHRHSSRRSRASTTSPFVVVPAGTRNHFALDLGLDRDDVPGALDAYEDGVDTVVDLAEVNGRVFVNNASMGAYAKIVQSADYRPTSLAGCYRSCGEVGSRLCHCSAMSRSILASSPRTVVCRSSACSPYDLDETVTGKACEWS
jgi:Diacylglycerol kinase catalytic domain